MVFKKSLIRMMEIQCRKTNQNLPEFSITTLGIIIRGREGENETDLYRGKSDNWGLEREGKTGL